MIFSIDTTSSVPIYAQIVEQVKYALAAGILRAGDPLPSLRQTANRLRVNPLTVSKAYRALEADGIIVTDHGRGSFISTELPKLGDEYRRESLERAVGRMIVEAYHLGASPKEIRAVVKKRLNELLAKEEKSHGE